MIDNEKLPKSGLVLPELSYQIMGVLYQVHNELGPTLLEKYYQRAVEKGLKEAGLVFVREFLVKLDYQGESIGRYFLDFVIEGKVILEIKAQFPIQPSFFKQAAAYLRQTGFPLAILANFRSDRLYYRRIVNPTNRIRVD